MTIDEALIQLKSPDAEMRRQAVIEVGKSKNPSMLPVLAEIYRSDSDANVRDMALKAGQYIRANMGPQAPTDPVSTQTAAAVSTAPVSELNRERAAGYMSQALDFQMRGNVLKAAELLGRAFDLNPALANDPLAQNLAADLTGQGPTAAARTFLDRSARAQFIAAKGGRAASVTGGGAVAIDGAQTGWGGALLDLLIYGLAAGALTFILMMVAVRPLADFMVQVQQSASATQLTPAQQLQMQQFEQQVQALRGATTLAAALPLALFSALGAIFGLLIEAGLEHLIVKSALGGSGMLTSLIHKLAFLQIILLAIGGVLFVAFVLALLPIFTQAQTQPNMQLDSTLFWGLWLAIMVFAAAATYFRARIIARNYSVSWFRGCATMILYVIVVFALQLCLSAAAGGLFASLFNGVGSGTGTF